MLFSLKEITKLTRFSVFELLVHVLSILVFSILIALRIDGVVELSWPICFTPLFCADGLNAYFALIIFIRLHAIKENKQAGFRTLWSLLCVSLMFVGKLLVCQTIEDSVEIKCGEALAPTFVLIVLLMFKACQGGGSSNS